MQLVFTVPGKEHSLAVEFWMSNRPLDGKDQITCRINTHVGPEYWQDMFSQAIDNNIVNSLIMPYNYSHLYLHTTH